MSDKPVLFSQLPLTSIKAWLSSKFRYGVLVRLNDEANEAAWYWGMSHADAAKLLYRMADEIVEQHCPPVSRGDVN